MTSPKALAFLKCTAVALLMSAASASSAAPQTFSGESALDAIRDYVTEAAPTETQRIDLVRSFVYRNSVHDALQPYSWDIPRVVGMLWETHAGTGEKAKLNCGPRALAMRSILDHIGIDSRPMMVFTDAGPAHASHTFVEVFNRDTRAWEIQDPDFDVKYLNRDGTVLATADLLSLDLETVIPVSRRGRGWKQNGVDHLRQNYFELAVYFPRDTSTDQHLVLVNVERFDLEKVFTNDGKTFPEYVKKRYRGAPVVEVGRQLRVR